MPTVDLGDIQLHYQRRGEGPPLLGIMGFGLDQRFWASQIPVVTETREFITFDNRGVGRSRGSSPLVTTIEDMADDTYRLLESLEIDNCVVFGISMGGAIAQHLALEHPNRVSALVLGVTWARPIEFMRRQHVLARALIQAGAIPGAKLVTLETGHGCMIEEMPAFNAALQAFLSKL